MALNWLPRPQILQAAIFSTPESQNLFLAPECFIKTSLLTLKIDKISHSPRFLTSQKFSRSDITVDSHSSYNMAPDTKYWLLLWGWVKPSSLSQQVLFSPWSQELVTRFHLLFIHISIRLTGLVWQWGKKALSSGAKFNGGSGDGANENPQQSR